jgi:hypothetical protein
MAETPLHTDKNRQQEGGLAPPPPAPPKPTRSPTYSFVEPPPHPQSAKDNLITAPNCNIITNTNVPLIKTPNGMTVTGEKDKKPRVPNGLRKATRRRLAHRDGSPDPQSKSFFNFDSSDDDQITTEQATVIRRHNEGRTKWTPESWKVEGMDKE